MADVNINNPQSVDSIGELLVEGFYNPKINSSMKHGPNSMIGQVYPGETLNFYAVAKINPSTDVNLWQKCISRAACQANIHNPKATPSLERDKGNEDENQMKLSCPVIVTYTGTSSKSTQCVGDLDLDICDFKESSSKPHFRDERTYIIPMSVVWENVQPICQYVELHVVVWMYMLSVQTSESSPELEGSAVPEMNASDTQPRRIIVPLAKSEVFEDDENEKENHIVAKESQPAKTESQPSKTRIPVAHSEFFDVGSDEEEVVAGDQRLAEESLNTSDATQAIKSGSGRGEKHLELKENQVKASSSSCSLQEKKVIKTLQVQAPPDLQVRHSMAGQKQLVILTVSNKAEKQMVIKSIHMLYSPPQLHGDSAAYEQGDQMKWESCSYLMKLECPRKGHNFPVILAPCETLDLIYKLQLTSVPADSELSLRASVKWTHAGATNEITTVYRLPRIRIRSPPFIVGIKCEEEVELGKTFYVTYTIYNQLHDFMSMRLYYNLENMYKSILEKGGSKDEMTRVDIIRNAVVCHDPDIPISSCPRGSCVCVPVGFQIHRPGLYEMSELMKVNLLYSFPENPRRDQRSSPQSLGHSSKQQPQQHHQQQQQQQKQQQHKQLQATNSSSSSVSATSDYGASASSPSSSSPSLQSTDDPERSSLLASEELWRGRSGSTNSLATPPPALTNLSAEEKRKTFAAKSYSFGDLGPNASADSDQGERNKQKPVKRSSMVAPSRPPPPKQLSKTERDLVRPSNFLKQPFYVHVRDPLTI